MVTALWDAIVRGVECAHRGNETAMKVSACAAAGVYICLLAWSLRW